MFQVSRNSYSGGYKINIPFTRADVGGVFIKVELPRLLATEIGVPSVKPFKVTSSACLFTGYLY